MTLDEKIQNLNIDEYLRDTTLDEMFNNIDREFDYSIIDTNSKYIFVDFSNFKGLGGEQIGKLINFAKNIKSLQKKIVLYNVSDLFYNGMKASQLIILYEEIYHFIVSKNDYKSTKKQLNI